MRDGAGATGLPAPGRHEDQHRGALLPKHGRQAVGDLSVFQRLGSDQAQAQNMSAFLTLCGKATTAACAFSAGTSAATTAKWNTLLSRLSKHPVTLGSPAVTYTYALTIASVPLGQVSQWQSGATLLQQLWLASSGRHVPAGSSPSAGASAGGSV
jgi:hypothetical protein